MTRPVALQLYSVREAAAADFFATLKRVARMHYAGVELAGLHNKPAADVGRVLHDLGLIPCSAHVPPPTRENIDQLAADAAAIKYSRIVTGFGENEMRNENGVKACAEKFARALELARSAGLALAMHNHWWEFDRAFNGKTPFEIILGAVPQLETELDIYWCAKSGADVPAVVRKWSARMPLMHVKDGDLGQDGIHTAVGKGVIPIKSIIDAAGPNNPQWLVVELDACKTDMMEAVERSYRWLVQHRLGHGHRR